MPKKITTKIFVEKVSILHNFKYNYSKSVYENNSTKIEIVCNEHGSFRQTPSAHLQGQGCPKCAYKKCGKYLTKNTEIFTNDATTIHGKKYDYSKADYKNNHTNVEIICSDHGSFFMTPNAHVIQKQGCPICGIEKRNDSLRSNVKEFIKKANTVHNFNYDYSKVYYKNARTKVCIICLDHGEFWQTPDKHLRGNECPKCTYEISKPEIEFLDYLKIPNTIKYRQVDIFNKRVDGLIGNTVYEFLGDYFHGNPKKYKSNVYNKICRKTFGELYENTFKRFELFKNKGYNIKYIWECDWNKFQKGIDKTPNIMEF